MSYRYCLSLLFYLVISLPTKAQIITSYVGNSISGYTGDGGPATAAEISGDSHIASDLAGNLYILGTDYRLRMVNTSGIINTIAGTGISCFDGAGYGNGGPASVAHLDNGSQGIYVDASGNVYISSSIDIRIINPLGIISNFAGFGSISGYGGDNGPATAALFFDIWAISGDVSGNIYISDEGNYRVRKVDPMGIVTTVGGNGTLGYSGDGGPATNAALVPQSITNSLDGSIYISDYVHGVIRKINPAGIISTYAGTGAAGFGGDGGPATAAQFETLWGIKMDTTGNLFICDANKVRKVNTAGIINTIAGTGVAGFSGDGGPATACEFHTTNSITTVWNSCGEHIFVSEQDNNNVREIVDYNHLPLFTEGHTHVLNLCEDTGLININTMLAITDSDSGQTETWWVIKSPAHGTLIAAFSAVSTGGVITPSGLTYTPTTGFIGADTFRVMVIDCGNAPDSATFYVTVIPTPEVSPISGLDTVCYHKTITLTDTATGGSWFATNANAIVTAGIVQGEHTGLDTVSYMVANGCGSTKVSLPIYVKDCSAGLSSLVADEEITIYPNPSTGSFTLKFPPGSSETASITITNMMGQKVKEMTASTLYPINLQLNSPPGIYFLTAVSSHILWSNKVIIR